MAAAGGAGEGFKVDTFMATDRKFCRSLSLLC